MPLIEAGLPLVEGVLGSKARARLLSVFVAHPVEGFYAQQVVRQTGLSETAVRYALPRMERLGFIIAQRQQGKEKLHRVNDRHPLYA